MAGARGDLETLSLVPSTPCNRENSAEHDQILRIIWSEQREELPSSSAWPANAVGSAGQATARRTEFLCAFLMPKHRSPRSPGVGFAAVAEALAEELASSLRAEAATTRPPDADSADTPLPGSYEAEHGRIPGGPPLDPITGEARQTTSGPREPSIADATLGLLAGATLVEAEEGGSMDRPPPVNDAGFAATLAGLAAASPSDEGAAEGPSGRTSRGGASSWGRGGDGWSAPQSAPPGSPMRPAVATTNTPSDDGGREGGGRGGGGRTGGGGGPALPPRPRRQRPGATTNGEAATPARPDDVEADDGDRDDNPLQGLLDTLLRDLLSRDVLEARRLGGWWWVEPLPSRRRMVL